MKYFITGGAGFIGSTMVDALSEKNVELITIYDNLNSGKEQFLRKHRRTGYFHFLKADILDFEELKKSMADHDFVFHFTSNPDIAKSVSETDLDLKQGIIATYNVLESMRLNSIKKIVYPSGSGIYGEVPGVFTTENYGPLLPISLYGASKLGCEALISAFCHMFDMQAWIFRLANVVGGRQTHGVGYDFIRKLKANPKELTILGNGKQSKSYIHIEDVIEAIFTCIDKSKERVNIFNVASNDNLDVNTIAQIAIEEMELKNVKITYTGGDRGWMGDVPVIRFNLDKIHQLGWRSKYTSTEAMRKSIKEMLSL
jgi:UDP-glucose 4-epimerase